MNMEFWHWYFRKNGPYPVLRGCAGICLCVGWIFFIRWFDPEGFRALLPLLKDPLFAISFVILIGSIIDLDYMEFRLLREHPAPPPFPGTPSLFRKVTTEFVSRIQRQKTVPARYKEEFGTDGYVLIWKWRLLFVALFFVAVVRTMFVSRGR
jgi:hypothetical protein